MRLVMYERQELKEPEVTILYPELTESVKRVSDFVSYVDQTILCKKDNEEYTVLINDIFYVESVCVTRKYLKDIRSELLRRNRG